MEAVVELDSRKSILGVNLEGKKYDGWPISRLIGRELVRPRLFDVVTIIDAPESIEVLWERDYWQVNARPKILERRIAPTPIFLDKLDLAGWRQAVAEAQACLDPSKSYQGRAIQVVTLAATKGQKSGEVSPHLQFRRTLWTSVPRDKKSRISMVQKVREELQPLYEFVKKRCAL